MIRRALTSSLRKKFFTASFTFTYVIFHFYVHVSCVWTNFIKIKIQFINFIPAISYMVSAMSLMADTTDNG